MKCSVTECERLSVSNSLCLMHYKRLRRNGTTDRVHKSSGGLTSKEYRRKHYTENKSRYRDLGMAYRENHKEKVSAYHKQYRKQNPDRCRGYQLKKFGLTVGDYNKMFSDQKGCCAICGVHQSEFKKRLAVDHNHITGQVRRLLCSNCNKGIGNLQEDIQILHKAIAYLQTYQSGSNN